MVLLIFSQNCGLLALGMMDIVETPVSQTDATGARFDFGKNWVRFLETLNDERISDAEDSLRFLLCREDITGSTMLDAGSGSGLFSLAAYRLGAEVTSFDLDADSVACTEELRRRYAADTDQWDVLSGSLLDKPFLNSLEEFDIVYCWGVAHHTGAMWTAIDNLLPVVKPGGALVLAIYNDQLYISRVWSNVKQIYQRLPGFLQPVYVAAVGLALFIKRLAVTLSACILRLVLFRNPLRPFVNWSAETQARGMHAWHDLVDWVGGWPFEVAKPEEVFHYLRDRGFKLEELITSTGHGCNEFAFIRSEEKIS